MIWSYLFFAVVFVVVGYTDLSAYIQLYKYYRIFFDRLYPRFRVQIEDPYYPHVLIQIPAYRPDNLSSHDCAVAEEQLINTVKCIAAMRWQKDRLWIQIIDQSSIPIMFWGFPNIEVIESKIRTGKADNMNYGLSKGFGTDPRIAYVAVFDSDFRPGYDWLEQAIGYMESKNARNVVPDDVTVRQYGRVGCVQTRWIFSNQNANQLTRTTSLLLHSHFCVEKVVSERDIGTSYFNGSGSVWLRECIDDCGGWPSVPFAQDLAMSNVAQKLGWLISYNPLIVSPNELASTYRDFLDQQRRWACGGTMQGNKFWYKNYFLRLLLYILCCSIPHTYWAMLFALPCVVTMPYYYYVGRISGMSKSDALSSVLSLPWFGMLAMLWCSWGVVNAWLPTKKYPSVTKKRTV